ncbi:MAG: hypothetical protein Q9220_003610 [cf. Caloplaca sp. 1 TL-2023]
MYPLKYLGLAILLVAGAFAFPVTTNKGVTEASPLVARFEIVPPDDGMQWYGNGGGARVADPPDEE